MLQHTHIAFSPPPSMEGMIDPALFDALKTSMEEDIKVRDELNRIIQSFEREIAYTQGVLSRVHSTPRAQCETPLICRRPHAQANAHQTQLSCRQSSLPSPKRSSAWASLRRSPRSTPTTSMSARSIMIGPSSDELTLRSRYNQRWNRHIQDAILTVLLCAWLGGLAGDSREGELGRLLTLEEVGGIFKGSPRPPPAPLDQPSLQPRRPR